MFRQSSYHTIDPKGRIIIPSRFRDVIRASGDESIMLTMLDGCLVGYTMDEWRIFEEQLKTLSVTSSRMRRFRRIFIGEAAKCTCDRQGRVLIPPVLREYGKFEKEIVLVGVLDHFEIWSRERWDQEKLSLEDDMKEEEFSNEIAKLGL